MVIEPNELRSEEKRKKKKEIVKDLLEETEEFIDVILLERSPDFSFIGQISIEIHIEELPFPWSYRLNSKIREAIEKMYEEKGWIVKFSQSDEILLFLEKR